MGNTSVCLFQNLSVVYSVHLEWKGLIGLPSDSSLAHLLELSSKSAASCETFFVMAKSSQFMVKFDLEELPKVILNHYW